MLRLAFVAAMALLLGGWGVVLAQPVTYQGHLELANVAHDGSIEMRFSLWDDESAGDQVGITVSKQVVLTGGLFQVELDFGPEAHFRQLGWLEIEVDDQTLSPRQPIQTAPRAWHAVTTDSLPHCTGCNIIYVAKSGASFESIQAAIDSIPEDGPDAPSLSNPYLIKIAPGVYHERVVMRQAVSIRGSGLLATRITFPGGSDEISDATLQTAHNSLLSAVRVQSTGSSDGPVDYAVAIHNVGNGLIEDSMIEVIGAGELASHGILSSQGSVQVSRSTIRLFNGGKGITTRDAGSASVVDSTVLVSGGSGENAGIHIDQGGSLNVRSSEILAFGIDQAVGNGKRTHCRGQVAAVA